MKALIVEEWAEVKQEWINKLVLSMLERLEAVIANQGKMTGY